MEQEEFSLEDDDYGNIFITQESSSNSDVVFDLDKSGENEELFLGVKLTDFKSPNVSQVDTIRNPMYSDISDDDDLEDFQIPSSQKR